MSVPPAWGRHAGCPRRHTLGDGQGSPGVSCGPFLGREQQCWLARGWDEGRQGPRERGCGQGARGSPNMQSPAAPKTRLPFEESHKYTNTATSTHAERALHPRGAPGQEPAPSPPSGLLQHPWAGPARGLWILSTRYPDHSELNPCERGASCLCFRELPCAQLCLLAQDTSLPGWSPVSPLQGSGAQGCREGVKGARRDVLSPAPRGPGLREGGGASLISLPPWLGGPLVLRRLVGGPVAASLKPGKAVPESTGAAAAGGAVGPRGVRPRLASWVSRSCWWRHGGSEAGATWLSWPSGCRCRHRGSSRRP